jgi:hypothetical protein
LRGIPGVEMVADSNTVTGLGIGMITRLENLPTRLPRALNDMQAALAQAVETVAEADQRLGAPFQHSDELAGTMSKFATVNAKLAAQMNAAQMNANHTATTADVASPVAAPLRAGARPNPIVRRRPADPNTGPVAGPATPSRPGPALN